MRRGAHPLTDRLQRRLALPGRSGPQPPAGRLALVGRVGQQVADGRRPPDQPPRRGWHPSGRELRGQSVQRHPTGRIRGEQLGDHHGSDRVDLERGGVPGPLGVQPVAIGCPRPGQQLPAAQPGLPPAPHPVGDQGPLVLGDRAADLGDQLLMGVVAQGAVAEHHPHAAAFQLFQDHHLVHEVAGQPVRRTNHHHIERRAGCVVAKRVQAGTVQPGAAVAVIAEDVLLADGPPVAGRGPRHAAGSLAARWSGRVAGGRWTRARTTPLASAAPSLAATAAGAAQRNTSWYAWSHRSCPSGCSLVSRRTSKVRRMAALPLLTTQSEGLHQPIRPQPQRPPPPSKTKPAVAGPAELVTCDQTIEHTIRFWKQTLHWTLPRPRTPEQADRFTWAVAAGYTRLRLARTIVTDLRLPWEQPLAPDQLTPERVRRRFRAVLAVVGTPASAPKPHGRSPGRPRGTLRGPAPRYPAIKLTA